MLTPAEVLLSSQLETIPVGDLDPAIGMQQQVVPFPNGN